MKDQLEPPHCSCGAYPGGACDDAYWENCATKAKQTICPFCGTKPGERHDPQCGLAESPK